MVRSSVTTEDGNELIYEPIVAFAVVFHDDDESAYTTVEPIPVQVDLARGGNSEAHVGETYIGDREDAIVNVVPATVEAYRVWGTLDGVEDIPLGYAYGDQTTNPDWDKVIETLQRDQ